jgi:hypothetical protein
MNYQQRGYGTIDHPRKRWLKCEARTGSSWSANEGDIQSKHRISVDHANLTFNPEDTVLKKIIENQLKGYLLGRNFQHFSRENSKLSTPLPQMYYCTYTDFILARLFSLLYKEILAY